jgi:hypothetical protein
MMIAQLSGADALHVKDFLIIALALAMPIIAIIGLVLGGKRKIEPDPLRVQKVENLVTKDFCLTSHNQIYQRLDGHDQQIGAIRQEMKHDRETSESAARVRSAGIYNKMDDNRRELSDKIDALPAQLIAMLRNTGAIK